jgi:hypothetical protein
MKKTISVAQVVAMVNRRNNDPYNPETRKGWNWLLEEILSETGNYSGYVVLGDNTQREYQLT